MADRGMIGANIAELRSLATEFDAAADNLEAEARQVTSGVKGTSWLGIIADEFRKIWTGLHLLRIHALAQELRDAARTIRANADDQEHASSAGGSSSHDPLLGGLLVGGVTLIGQSALQGTGNPQNDNYNPQNPGVTSLPHDAPPQTAPGYAGAFSDGSKWTNDWKRQPNGYDQWGFGYQAPDGKNHGGDCTSFVAWRLNQLAHTTGHPAFSFTDGKIVSADGSVSIPKTGLMGNAATWYANAPTQFRASEPSVGSVVVWPPTKANFYDGHVAIVTGVHPSPNGGPPTIDIEQSSWNGATYSTATLAPGQYPNQFLNFLP